MAKVKGQQIPPEFQKKYNKMFNSRIDGIVSSKKSRISSPSEKQRKNRQEFYRASIYWISLTEKEKANIYNAARNNAMRYFNYFVSEVYKKRLNNIISKYGFKIEEYNCTYGKPVGLAVSNNKVFVADEYTGNIYALDYTLNEIGYYNQPGENIQGMTWDGTGIWTVNGATGKIYRIINGTIDKEYYFRNCNFKCITSDRNSLWIYDKENKKIVNMLPNGNLTNIVYENIEKEIEGLAWDGFRLWTSVVKRENNEFKLKLENYKIPEGNEIEINIEPLIENIYNLCRLSRTKKNNEQNKIDITAENLNIQLNNISIKNKHIWVVSKDMKKIYKIKVVGDIQ